MSNLLSVLKDGAHVSRVGVSLLASVGLPELIAQKPVEYVQIASNLAKDSSHLATIRAELRGRMQQSALMDQSAFNSALQQAYHTMWQDFCRKEPS